ncbi:BgTH12-00102 [Blumeria graminis f. sp. triticale]|uniref:BgTH12-00102 n=1 Tax=Blumeria graminis f. sp. triticale TaxID=1689686 RepID=A0A9W4GGG3_BLUGR|nr:BgTH12-00102 [Blumeria graminis f. sp. triticale]
MRPDTAALYIIFASSLLPLVHSLPYITRKPSMLGFLTRRAPYAIIPVDGGPADDNGDNTPVNTPQPSEFTTVFVAETQTTVETDIVTMPPMTDHVTSIETIQGPTVTQMSEVTTTATASPLTVTETSYSVVDVSSPPSTVTVSAVPSGTSTSETETFQTSQTASQSSPENSATQSSPEAVPNSTSSAPVSGTSLPNVPDASSTDISSNYPYTTTSVATPTSKGTSSVSSSSESAPTPTSSSSSESVPASPTTSSSTSSRRPKPTHLPPPSPPNPASPQPSVDFTPSISNKTETIASYSSTLAMETELVTLTFPRHMNNN